MKTATKKVTKKSRGRPATGTGVQVGERWSEEAIERIDNWRRAQTDLPGRPEAIRRLVEIGLGKSKPMRRSGALASRAKELADGAVDRLVDPATSPEEKAVRRRRLVKGPSEFREQRMDQPRTKKVKSPTEVALKAKK